MILRMISSVLSSLCLQAALTEHAIDPRRWRSRAANNHGTRGQILRRKLPFCASPLKDHFQSHLDDPRGQGPGDTAEIAVGNRGIRVVQQGVIREVEELGAVLQSPTFVNRKYLMSGEIDVERTGSTQDVARGVGESPEFR